MRTAAAIASTSGHTMTCIPVKVLLVVNESYTTLRSILLGLLISMLLTVQELPY
jgi:hypothetical protein